MQILEEYTTQDAPQADVSEAKDAGSDVKPRYPGAFSSAEPTPFEKSGDRKAVEEYAATPDALHNDRAPFYPIKHERPEHRVIVFLKAQGLSNKEVAERVGMTPVAVSNILRQPWARTRLTEEIAKAGRDEVELVLRGAVLDSIETIMQVRDDPEAKPSERKAAAEYLVDRVLGRPSATVNVNQKKVADMDDSELISLLQSARG